MRVAFVNQYAIPPRKGGGTRHHGLGKALIGRGHEVSVVAGTSGLATTGAEAQPEAVRVALEEGVPFAWVRVPTYRGNSVGRLRNMLSFARGVEGAIAQIGDVDAVLGSSPHLFAAEAARKAARRRKVRFVLEIRDIWPQSLVSILGLSRRHPLVLWLAALERRLYRDADAIVSLLPGLAEHVRGFGVLADKVTTIPNGIDLALCPRPEPLPDRAHFEILYAGAHGPPNCLEPLVDAAALLDRGSLPIRFRLIGDGVSKASLVARAKGLRNLAFEPPVAKAEVFAKLAEADAFVAVAKRTPLYAHGISFNKLFDYMAAARPILFSAEVPGNPVEQAGCGLVVEAESAVAIAEGAQRLFRMAKAERGAMAAAGRRFVEERHDLANLAERLEAVLAASY